MKLYGKAPTRVVRAMWLINELGLECERIETSLLQGDHQRTEFRSLNPAGRVPVLVDGDMVLTESVAIALYLAEKFPEKGLIPSDPAGRAQMFRWLFFVVSEIEAPLERIGRNTQLYPEEQRQPADVSLARRECEAMLTVLDTHLQGQEYLLGEQVSVADFVTAYTLDWANEEGLLSRTSRLRDYLAAMYARPAAPPTIAQAFAALRGD